MPSPAPDRRPPAPGVRMIAIVGSTASGKSELGMALAQQLGGEIVNADAFQLYRGMDIGTAKPGAAERELVPHHALDWWDLRESASVARYQQDARASVVDICSRGRTPIVVGGSPLYVRALCDELDLPPQDPQVRRRLQAQADEVGAAAMFEQLRAVAPDAAADMDPRNLRRVIRALEVVELTGTFRARLPEPVSWVPTLFLAPRRSRADLDRRIDQLTHMMWQQGMIEEVARLLEQGLASAPTASRAVGYPQAADQIAGLLSAAEAQAATAKATRALARRQERTFRGDRRVHWVDGDDPAEALATVREWDQPTRR